MAARSINSKAEGVIPARKMAETALQASDSPAKGISMVMLYLG